MRTAAALLLLALAQQGCAATECAGGADMDCIRSVASREDLQRAISMVGPCYAFGAALCEKQDQCGALPAELGLDACIDWWVAEVCSDLAFDPAMMTHCSAWADAIDCPYFELGAAFYNGNAQPCEAEYPHPIGAAPGSSR